jgi:hypothetical protein
MLRRDAGSEFIGMAEAAAAVEGQGEGEGRLNVVIAGGE